MRRFLIISSALLFGLFASGCSGTRVPLQSEIQNIQPMTGIVLWSNNALCETEKDKLQLEFAYLLYSDI